MSKLSVLYESMFWDPADGWQIAVRSYARALEMAGVEVSLVSPVPWIGAPDPGVLAEVGHMARHPSRWDLYIYGVPCMGPAQMWRPLRTLSRGALPPRVFYTMLERKSVDPDTARAVSLLEGVWVPCRANVETLRRCGVTTQKIGYVPYPFFNDDPYLGLFGLNRAPGVPRFLWGGRWEPRKAPDNLVRAFLRAFAPGKASITLKLGPTPLTAQGFPIGPEVVAVDEIQQNPAVSAKGWTTQNYQQHIHILRGRLPAAQMIQLHAEHDIYVSPSRGEGIDLPTYRAKLAGKRVVATYSGGPEDFLGSHDIRVPESGLVKTHPVYGWEPEALYGNYEIDDLTKALVLAADGPLTSKEHDWPIDSFRARAVAPKMLKLVEKAIDEAPR